MTAEVPHSAGSGLPIKTRHLVTACLVRWGWVRNNDSAEDIGECLNAYGCGRPGRWSHPYRQGYYCAQHAHAGGPNGFGGH